MTAEELATRYDTVEAYVAEFGLLTLDQAETETMVTTAVAVVR